MKKTKKIIFDGKLNECSKFDFKKEDFTIDFWVSTNKKDNTHYIVKYLPYWHPFRTWCHHAIVVEKGKKEVKYFDGLQICKENWAKILDEIFQPIKTWNKPARYTLSLGIK